MEWVEKGTGGRQEGSESDAEILWSASIGGSAECLPTAWLLSEPKEARLEEEDVEQEWKRRTLKQTRSRTMKNREKRK